MKTASIIYPLIATVAMLTGALGDDVLPDGTKLIKISKKRIPMDTVYSTICGRFDIFPPNPHESSEAEIFVNKVVLEYRKKNPEKYDYPIGSTFVKKKFTGRATKIPELATIMVRKKKEGAVTDWEFRMVSLPGHKAIRPNAQISCTKCHGHYKDRGYVSSVSEKILRQHLKLPIKAEPVDPLYPPTPADFFKPKK